MKERGFTLVELALSLAILSVITLATFKLLTRVRADAQLSQERYRVYVLERAIKTSFLDVVSVVERNCFPSSDSFSVLSWGYLHSSCGNTSPLPYLSSTSVLRYDVNLGLDPSLRNRIVGNFVGACVLQRTDNSTYLELFCPDLISLTYDGATRFHSLSNHFPTHPPSRVEVQIRRRGWTNPITYTLSLDDLFQERQRYSVQKMQELMEKLRSESQYLSNAEFNNPPPTGLPSGDDVLVPYFWKVFSNDYSNAKNTLCNTGGGNTCTNYTSSVWRTGTVSQTLLLRRVVQNLMNGEVRYYTDGFGNAVSLVPFVSRCSSSLSSCSVSSPPVPQRFYSPNPTPPYTSVLYNFWGRDTSNPAPLFDRYYVVH